jgi:tRNA (guanine-N7-)-methyltransferase
MDLEVPDYYPALMQQRKKDLADQLAPLFADPKPFVWEVGSGHGHFLTAYAQAHQDQLCIGIDLIGDRIVRGTRKRDRAKLPNLHFIHAEARLFLEMLPPTATIATVFILFPDPWPKTRHHKNRIIQTEFLSQLRTRMAPTGHLYFRTDFEPYFAAARATLTSHPDWQLCDSPWAFEHETVFQHRAQSYHSLVARPRDKRKLTDERPH